MKKNKNFFKTRVLALRQAFLPISYKLTAINFNLLETHNKMLRYQNDKFSSLERNFSMQFDNYDARLNALVSRLQTTNMILLLYGIALTAILIILLFI